MIFSDDELKTTFEVSDQPTYREMLRYDAAVEMHPDWGLYERLWSGVCAVAQAWTSEYIPKLDAGILDMPLSDDGMKVIKWASLSVFSWSRQFKDVPKN